MYVASKSSALYGFVIQPRHTNLFLTDQPWPKCRGRPAAPGRARGASIWPTTMQNPHRKLEAWVIAPSSLMRKTWPASCEAAVPRLLHLEGCEQYQESGKVVASRMDLAQVPKKNTYARGWHERSCRRMPPPLCQSLASRPSQTCGPAMLTRWRHRSEAAAGQEHE